MATREAIEARKEALERELARRVVESLSTSERQAAYITGRDVLVIADDERDADERERDDEREREAAWGDEGERPKKPLTASERQAARVTRGRA